jgi:hypothetical protein
MTGKSLRPVIETDTAVRETAIFGQHGYQVNITDGRYVYMRGPASEKNQPLNEYTVMPAHMRSAFQPGEFEGTTLAEPFRFTKGVAPLRIPAKSWAFGQNHPDRMATRLYHLETDPLQRNPLEDSEREAAFCAAILEHFEELDAPPEQRQRLGL